MIFFEKPTQVIVTKEKGDKCRCEGGIVYKDEIIFASDGKVTSIESVFSAGNNIRVFPYWINITGKIEGNDFNEQ